MFRKPRELSSPSPREQSLTERQNAIVSADGGNIRLAADLTGAAITECGWIAGIVKTIAQGIPGLPRTFTGPPDLVRALEGVTKKQAAEAAKRGEILEPRRGIYGDIFPEAEQYRMIAWGLTLGVCCVQRIPVPVDPCAPIGKPRPTFRMQARHPRFLRYEIMRDVWWIQEFDGERCINECPEEYSLFLPYGSLKPWEMAPWKAITLAYLMWRDGQFDRSRHSAMNGPIVWWRAGEHTTPQNKKDAEVVMADIERRARVCMQRGEEIGVTAPPAGDIAGVYRDIILDMKADVEIDLLGNQVVTGSKSTGFGDNQTFERGTARRIDFMASALERFEQRYVLDVWAPEQRAGARIGIMYDTRAPSVVEASGAEPKPASQGAPLAPAEAPDQDLQVEPDQVLNGAQIAAAVDIVVQVATGTLPRDSGLRLLETGFNLEAHKALEIMGNAGRTPQQVAA